MSDALPGLFDDDKSIDGRFWKFHKENPWILDALIRLAREARRRGHKKGSIDFLMHVLRWEDPRRIEKDRSGYKLNDHYTSRYMRAIIAKAPDLADWFEIRKLRTK